LKTVRFGASNIVKGALMALQLVVAGLVRASLAIRMSSGDQRTWAFKKSLDHQQVIM